VSKGKKGKRISTKGEGKARRAGRRNGDIAGITLYMHRCKSLLRQHRAAPKTNSKGRKGGKRKELAEGVKKKKGHGTAAPADRDSAARLCIIVGSFYNALYDASATHRVPIEEKRRRREKKKNCLGERGKVNMYGRSPKSM